MKRFFLIFLLAASLCATAVVLMAAKHINIDKLSPNMTTRTFSVGAFSKLDVSRVDVVFTPGPATGQVVVTAPENIAPHIVVKVKDNTLEIGLDNNVQFNRGSLNSVAKVTAPTLTGIDAGLSSKVSIAGDLVVNGKLDIEAGTSVQVTGPTITVKGDCEIDACTSAKVSFKSLNVSGKADLEATTSGVVNLDKLTATRAELEASTSGTIKVGAGNSVRAKFDASTSGSIKADGFVPQQATADASTSGSITLNCAKLTNSESSTGGKIRNTAR